MGIYDPKYSRIIFVFSVFVVCGDCMVEDDSQLFALMKSMLFDTDEGVANPAT